MTLKSIEVASGTLAVRDVGQGRPVLLVHGFPLTGDMWDAQVAALGQNYRAIAPDLRGFGRSQAATPECLTMEAYADDLALLLAALKIREPVVFCGLSMGGYIGWQFWRKYGAHLTALVACDTRAIADTPAAADMRREMAKRVLAEGTAVAADAMLPKLLAPATHSGNPALVERLRTMILSNPPAGIAAAQHGMAQRPDVTEWLPSIQLPALIVVGQHDAIATVDEMRGIAGSMPRAELSVIAGAGHLPPVEAPAEFNRALGAFLARLP